MGKPVEVRVLSAALFCYTIFMWLLFFLFFSKSVLAQNQEILLNKYRTDYFHQRDIYQKNYQEYLAKKNIFDQYGTVTAQKDKTDSTKVTLISQNTMLRAYLMALRTTLTDTPDNQKSLIEHENWLLSQNTTLNNLSTPADFQIWASDFQKRYIPIQVEIYKGLIQQQINNRQQILLKLKDIALRGNVDWDKNYISKEKIFTDANTDALAWTLSNQFEDRFSPFYEDAQKNLLEADNALKSIILDLKSTLIKKSGN